MCSACASADTVSLVLLLHFCHHAPCERQFFGIAICLQGFLHYLEWYCCYTLLYHMVCIQNAQYYLWSDFFEVYDFGTTSTQELSTSERLVTYLYITELYSSNDDVIRLILNCWVPDSLCLVTQHWSQCMVIYVALVCIIGTAQFQRHSYSKSSTRIIDYHPAVGETWIQLQYCRDVTTFVASQFTHKLAYSQDSKMHDTRRLYTANWDAFA